MWAQGATASVVAGTDDGVFAIGMALHSVGSYHDVLGVLTDGLAWADGDAEPVRLPSKSAIFQARERLGPEPVKALFDRVARPLSMESTPGAWLAGRRLVSIDGTTLDVADSDVNDEHFGRPGVNKGERSAFRKPGWAAWRSVRHTRSSTPRSARTRLGRIRSLATWSPVWNRACCVWLTAGSAAIPCGVWRSRPVLTCCGGQDQHDTSTDRDSRRRVLGWPISPQAAPQGARGEPLRIRVIDYQLDDGRGDPTGPYRLFTTLLDPIEAPAGELAFAYSQRWEIEIAFGELKTHQRGSKAVLRSKSPPLVEQEIWGHLCCHYAIRTLMFEAAHDADIDPDRVSFCAALRITRRSLSQARDFSP